MSLGRPLKHIAWWVQKANWQLFSGPTASSLSLTGSAPTVPFRCAITLAVGPDTITHNPPNPDVTVHHTDVTGDVYINAEKVSFISATKKTSTTLLTSLPTITTSGLDCNILVECMNDAGAPIQVTTNTPIKIGWEDYTKAIQDGQGNWGTATGSRAYTKNMLIGDLAIIQFDKLHDQDPTNGKPYKVVSTKEAAMTFGGRTLLRCLNF
jgi:hypothetical protein